MRVISLRLRRVILLRILASGFRLPVCDRKVGMYDVATPPVRFYIFDFENRTRAPPSPAGTAGAAALVTTVRSDGT